MRFDINNGITLCRSCHTKEDRKINPLPVWSKGKKFTAEHKAKLSAAKKGKRPNNYGVKGQKAWNKGIAMKESSKKLLSRKNKGNNKGCTWIIDSETGRRKWIDKV